jgi:hypothetical protein
MEKQMDLLMGEPKERSTGALMDVQKGALTGLQKGAMMGRQTVWQ